MRLILHVLICAALYAFTWRQIYFGACLLPRAAYEGGSVLLGVLQHRPALVLLLVGSLPLLF